MIFSMRFRSSLGSLSAAIVLSAGAACQRGVKPVDSVAIRADSIRRDSIARARQDSINRTLPGYVVDSIRPIEEEVRRFKSTLQGAPVETLQHASTSREALVKRIVSDVARRDSVDLAAAAVTPREFIDLVYPSSPYTHPPYRESPAIVWMQIANPSNSGYLRLFRRLGGQAFEYESHTCRDSAEHQGKNTLWLDCTIRVLNPQHETTTQRWFGTIIERDGRYKVMSFRNQF
jgi:hypothetical protein